MNAETIHSGLCRLARFANSVRGKGFVVSVERHVATFREFAQEHGELREFATSWSSDLLGAIDGAQARCGAIPSATIDAEIAEALTWAPAAIEALQRMIGRTIEGRRVEGFVLFLAPTGFGGLSAKYYFDDNGPTIPYPAAALRALAHAALSN